MALASPFFRDFELERRVDLVVPELGFGSPLDGGRAALGYHSLERTVEALGRDGAAYGRLLGPLVSRIDGVMDLTQHQLLRVPRAPVAAALFGLRTFEQGSPLWDTRFREELAPALLSGVAAHAVSQLPSLAAAGAGLMLTALAHAQGWPIPQGGSVAIAEALAADIRAHGGVIRTGEPIDSLQQLGGARATCWTSLPADCWTSQGTRCPESTAAPLRHSAMGMVPAKWITSCPALFRGQLLNWRTPEPCTLAARGRNWPGPRMRFLPGSTRNAPMSWWRNPRGLIVAGHRPGVTSCGRIAMSRPGQRGTWARP